MEMSRKNDGAKETVAFATDNDSSESIFSTLEAGAESEMAQALSSDESYSAVDETKLQAGGELARLYIDNCATRNVVGDRDFISDLHTLENPIIVRTAQGTFECGQVGVLSGFGNALFVEGSPNLVSLREVEDRYNVKYQQGIDFRIYDRVSHKLIVVFKRGRDGLYSTLIRKRLGEIINVLVDTVHSRALKYTAREIKRAEQARDAVRWMAFPSDGGLQYDIMHGGILNNPITSHNLEIAADIFGADVASFKRKVDSSTSSSRVVVRSREGN